MSTNIYENEDKELESVLMIVKKYWSKDKEMEYVTVGWKKNEGKVYGRFRELTNVLDYTDTEVSIAMDACMEEYQDFLSGNKDEYELQQ